MKITLESRGIANFSAIIQSPERANLPDILGLFVDEYRRVKPISPLLDDNLVLRFDRLPRTKG